MAAVISAPRQRMNFLEAFLDDDHTTTTTTSTILLLVQYNILHQSDMRESF